MRFQQRYQKLFIHNQKVFGRKFEKTYKTLCFVEKQVFLKLSSAKRRMQFWWPFPFFARSPIIMSWKSESDAKKISIRKNIFPPKVSSGAVAWKSNVILKVRYWGEFFSSKEISPKRPSNFWNPDSPKKKNMINILKNGFLMQYLLDTKDSVLTTRPKKSLQYTRIFYRLECVDVKLIDSKQKFHQNLLLGHEEVVQISLRNFFFQKCPLNP